MYVGRLVEAEWLVMAKATKKSLLTEHALFSLIMLASSLATGSCNHKKLAGYIGSMRS